MELGFVTALNCFVTNKKVDAVVQLNILINDDKTQLLVSITDVRTLATFVVTYGSTSPTSRYAG